MTKDHKPDCSEELARIREAGGKVVEKAGVPRVVWYRPHDPSHQVRSNFSKIHFPFLRMNQNCIHQAWFLAIFLQLTPTQSLRIFEFMAKFLEGFFFVKILDFLGFLLRMTQKIHWSVMRFK